MANGAVRHTAKYARTYETLWDLTVRCAGSPNTFQFISAPAKKGGGEFQVKDQSQDKVIPPSACRFWNCIWPSGLQISDA